MRQTFVFRALWPIVDETAGYAALCRQATEEIPLLTAQARAELAGPGRFSIAPSDRVPGSGRVTEATLVFEAPARRAQDRPYRLRLAS